MAVNQYTREKNDMGFKVLKYCFRCAGHKEGKDFDIRAKSFGGWCIKCCDTPVGQIPKI